MIYVALLRGINVGGNNKVDMKLLKITFENLGFTKVTTYINSGNVVFETALNTINTEKLLEDAIEIDFKIAIKVLVRDFENIKAINQSLPDNWVNNKEQKTDILFLRPDFDNPNLVKNFPKNDSENIIHNHGVIIWNITTENYDRSLLTKTIGSKIYKNLTARNVNTFRILYNIMNGLI